MARAWRDEDRLKAGLQAKRRSFRRSLNGCAHPYCIDTLPAWAARRSGHHVCGPREIRGRSPACGRRIAEFLNFAILLVAAA